MKTSVEDLSATDLAELLEAWLSATAADAPRDPLPPLMKPWCGSLEEAQEAIRSRLGAVVHRQYLERIAKLLRTLPGAAEQIFLLHTQLEDEQQRCANVAASAMAWDRAVAEGLRVIDNDLGIERIARWVEDSGDASVGIGARCYWELDQQPQEVSE